MATPTAPLGGKVFSRLLVPQEHACSSEKKNSPREVARICKVFRFTRKFNSDLCRAAPYYVQVRTKRWLRCPDQSDPRPDPNPNLTRILTPNLTLTHPFGGLDFCSRGRRGQYWVDVRS